MDVEPDHSQERPFRWGIVGTGAIARQFASDLKYVPQSFIAAVCSRSAESGEAFRNLAKASKAYTTLDAMLADPQLDAVYIATPNSLHSEQAIAALNAGKPVLVEKPLATTTAEAKAMLGCAAKNGVPLMEGLWTRFLPAAVAVRKMLDEKAIGDIVRVKGELAYFHADESFCAEGPDGRFFDPMLGGGAALDLGVYLLSLAIGLFGSPEEIDGCWRAAKSGVDYRADFRLHFADGVEAELSCGFDRNGDNAFTIFGTQGAIRLHPPCLKVRRVTLFRPPLSRLAGFGSFPGKVLARFPLPGKSAKSYVFPGGGLQFEAAAFACSVRQGTLQNEVMPVEDSIAVLNIIEAVKDRQPENRR